MTKKELQPDADYGREEIYFTGSKELHWRNLYGKNGKFYVQWYGEMIEVTPGRLNIWKTVEPY